MASYRAGARAGNEGGRATRLAAALVAVVLAGCSAERAPAPPASADTGNPVTVQAPDTGALALASGATGWRLRALAHAPDYFELVGWKDASTLFGRAGCNPVEVRVDAPEYTSWDLSACGGAVLAPDGERAAWSD